MPRGKKNQNGAAAQPAPKPAAKIAAKPKTAKTMAPSEKLAGLLRKESVLVAKAKKAKEELKAVQSEIRECWNERERQNQELLSDSLEV